MSYEEELRRVEGIRDEETQADWEQRYGKKFEDYRDAVRDNILTSDVYLLTKLAEEASEVAIEALKCANFGARHEFAKEHNVQRLIREVKDLQTVLLLLSRQYPELATVANHPTLSEAKVDRLAQYGIYSQLLGET